VTSVFSANGNTTDIGDNEAPSSIGTLDL